MTFPPKVHAKSSTVPFTSYTKPLLSSSKPGMITAFSCRQQDDRVFLNWAIQDNENADRLIIQRSRNGKKFEMAGLVFASDKSAAENYIFNEKFTARKTSYRIIIIRKDKSVEYSEVIHFRSKK